jgi:YidC/Oxa1 family membrane protein insertase
MFLFGAIPGLGPISKFFAEILHFFDSFTGNFTVSVILLTVAFRIIVLPLSFKQTKSMIAMQKLQPQLKEIQKQYKDDREKQGQEMMKLYKENKVSPLGGCLPLLIQLPILFALFDVLHNTSTYVLYKTSYGFLGIQNVIATGKVMWSGGTIKTYSVVLHKAVSLPYHGGEYLQVIILILLSVITGYVSSKMMMTDPKQSKLMAIMPVMLGVFAWILPAGVTIYIIVTNVLTILQQWVQLEREGFYSERREQRDKAGEPSGFWERMTANVKDPASKALVALKIKKAPEPEPKKKAPASKAASTRASSAKAASGNKAGGPSKAKQGTGMAGKPTEKTASSKAKKQPEKDQPQKQGANNKPDGAKPASAKPVSKGYPAKKNSKKK